MDEVDGMPIITLEVMSDQSPLAQALADDISPTYTESPDPNPGVHFLTETQEDTTPKSEEKDDTESHKPRTDMLEYMMRDDGSVVCKLCGEILQSRTHWYRHKYKAHVTHPLNPTPLFQCEQCLAYFKSRKGYIGHLSSRHSDVLADSTPVLTNSQAEANAPVKIPIVLQVMKQEPEPEPVVPPKPAATTYRPIAPKPPEEKRASRSSKDTSKKVDLAEKRSREEKMVTDIIDRVRRECEAQGGGGARRGYTRRTTVMNS